jgi:predicted nicotinamide N-methyase
MDAAAGLAHHRSRHGSPGAAGCMIAEDFFFDTTRIKKVLNWKPALTNSEMLVRAYQYYSAHRAEIEKRSGFSAHNKPASMGVIRLLKWFS